MPKILIFEDNGHFSELYVAQCQQGGLQVSLYENPGPDPASIVAEEKPDIISMDVNMPVMNGFEAARRIKADPRTKDISLFFLTTIGYQEDQEQGRALGAVDYLVKGQYNLSGIVKRVKELLPVESER